MGNILALDIATKTGWASCLDDKITSGVLDMSAYDDEGARASAFDDFLDRAFATHDHVIMETTFSTGFGKVDYRLNGLQYVAHMSAWDNNVKRYTVAPTKLKKFTTDNGRATKEDMMSAVESWGFKPQDDNEADALALLTYAQEELEL